MCLWPVIGWPASRIRRLGILAPDLIPGLFRDFGMVIIVNFREVKQALTQDFLCVVNDDIHSQMITGTCFIF